MILVFKTNLDKPGDIEQITKVLNGIPELLKWNVDLDDCDRVLRIEAESDIRNLVMATLSDTGFYCEELED